MNRFLTAIAVGTTLFASPAVFAASDAPVPVSGVRGGEAGSLHRTLRSVMLLKKLGLTDAQKSQLSGLLTEAKAQREKAREEFRNDPLKPQREALMQKAIAEARATGEISTDTKQQMAQMRDDLKGAREPFRAERKELVEKIKAVFTPEQLAAIKPAQGEGEKEGGQVKAHRKGAHKLFRLMMSDEFAAELAK